MKRNVVLEAQILKAIEVLGEATEPEILSEIKEQFGVEINDYEFMRNLRRWLAKKCITISKIKGENAYKLRDVPPFFKSLQMIHMKGLTATDAESVVAKLEQHYQALKSDIREPMIGDYHLLECQFETLDRVAGGDNGQEDRVLVFPTKEGKPYIRRNWMRGYLRDNARVPNVNGSFMSEYVGISDSELLDVETKRVDNVKVKEGMCSYEIIPTGTKFTMKIRFPLRGSRIKTVEDLKNMFAMLEEAPIRGLGAYSNYFGGRIKLLSIKELA
jgi:CRISPR/Cas system CSM-associated protein Csm3 (group 7 of RAMP superfamily)